MLRILTVIHAKYTYITRRNSHGVGEGEYIAPFFTSALNGGEWSTTRPGRFTPPPPGGK
jgi:hypothetical protein